MNETVNLSSFGNLRLERFMAEPKNRLGKAASIVSNIAQPLATRSTDFFSQISAFESLIEKQIEAQSQMMMINMQSNLLRTEHETKMGPVRNMRVA